MSKIYYLRFRYTAYDDSDDYNYVMFKKANLLTSLMNYFYFGSSYHIIGWTSKFPLGYSNSCNNLVTWFSIL